MNAGKEDVKTNKWGGGGEREENKGIQGSNLLNRQYKGIEYELET